jgi:uncharacterized repeat protein (TIGR01451 family)
MDTRSLNVFCGLLLIVGIALPVHAGTFFDSAVNLTANDSPAVPVGGNVNLTVRVSNLGTASGTDTVNVDVPSVFTVNSNNCGATAMPQGAYTLVTWSNIALTPGQVRNCVVALTLNTLPSGAASAFATLQGGGTNTGNNSSFHTFNVTSAAATADVAIDMTSTTTNANSGQQVAVTVVVNNNGPATANAVVATITPPASLRLDQAECASGTPANPFSWSVGSLASGASKSCALTLTVVATAPSPAILAGSVASSTADSITSNNQDSLSFTLGQVAYSGVELDIISSKPGPVKRDETFDYTMTLRNGSNTAVRSGQVVVALPAQLALQSSPCFAAGGNGLLWALPAVQAGATTSCAMTVKVLALPPNATLRTSAAASFTLASGQSGTASNAQEVGTVQLASQVARTLSGNPTTRPSLHPRLSADGKIVVFSSLQDDLVAGDSNSAGPDSFLLDRRTGQVLRLGSLEDGTQLAGSLDVPAVSGNGQSIAFLYNSTGGAVSLTGHDAARIAAGSVTVCSSPPNGLFRSKCLGGPGGAPPNAPIEGPLSFSSDGRYLAFCSAASNLVVGDNNNAKDVFVLDQSSYAVALVSATASGDAGNADSCAAMVSGNGKSVVFTSKASNFGGNGASTQTYRKNLASGELALISRGVNGGAAFTDATQPAISSDGARIAFVSRAANLESGVVPTANLVWVYDEDGTGNKLKAVRGAGGVLPNQDSDSPSISCNGRVVAFGTLASNLAPPDSNGLRDLYLYDVDSGVVRRAAAPQAGVEPNGGSSEPVLDCEGNTLAFDTQATNLSSGDTSPNDDVYAQGAPLRGDAAAITVDASFSGNWYNAGNDGHGFLLEALTLPGTPIYITWYVYQDGRALYLQGVASAVGNTLTADMYSSRSPGFPVGAGGATTQAWGKVKLTFTDADTGLAEWTPTAAGFSAGSMTLRRLTTPALTQSDGSQQGGLRACYSGVWADADPARIGYGLDFEVNDFSANARILTVYWYTYHPDGSPLWLLGAGPANDARVTIDLYEFSGPGAQFPPAFSRAGTTASKWGSATLKFTGNDTATLLWAPAVAGYTSGSTSLRRLTALATRTCN